MSCNSSLSSRDILQVRCSLPVVVGWSEQVADSVHVVAGGFEHLAVPASVFFLSSQAASPSYKKTTMIEKKTTMVELSLAPARAV